MTQKEKIMTYLRQHGEITVKEATYQLGITQPATRIKELIENDGEPIRRTKWRTVTLSDGTTTDVRVYELIKPGQSILFPEKHQSTYSGAGS